MAEIFLSYVSICVDFTVKVFIIAYVAREFEWISIGRANTAQVSNGAGGAPAPNAPQNVMPDFSQMLGGLLKQVAPALSQQMKNVERQPVSFSDDPQQAPSMVPVPDIDVTST